MREPTFCFNRDGSSVVVDADRAAELYAMPEWADTPAAFQPGGAKFADDNSDGEVDKGEARRYLDAKGVDYDARWGAKRLLDLMEQVLELERLHVDVPRGASAADVSDLLHAYGS